MLSKAASHVKTQNIIGTPMFMPPEYITEGRVSDKTDTYAFGMCIFVILTGKQLTKQVHVHERVLLGGHASQFVFAG